MQTTPTAQTRSLRNLHAIVAAYAGVVTERRLRDWIRRGRLPAAKVGREYIVDEADVEALLRPTLRTPAPRPERETPTQRAERQLREAGIG